MGGSGGSHAGDWVQRGDHLLEPQWTGLDFSPVRWIRQPDPAGSAPDVKLPDRLGVAAPAAPPSNGVMSGNEENYAGWRKKKEKNINERSSAGESGRNRSCDHEL